MDVDERIVMGRTGFRDLAQFDRCRAIRRINEGEHEHSPEAATWIDPDVSCIWPGSFSLLGGLGRLCSLLRRSPTQHGQQFHPAGGGGYQRHDGGHLLREHLMRQSAAQRY